MKKNLLILASILLLSLNGCVKKYKEYGENSVFYYFDGNPEIPVCSYNYKYQLSNIRFYNNELTVHICGNSLSLDYIISDYQGKKKYYFDSASGNSCSSDLSGGNPYDVAENHNTYLHILEIDPINKHFSATFEADFYNATDHIHKKVTKGRMDINYH